MFSGKKISSDYRSSAHEIESQKWVFQISLENHGSCWKFISTSYRHFSSILVHWESSVKFVPSLHRVISFFLLHRTYWRQFMMTFTCSDRSDGSCVWIVSVRCPTVTHDSLIKTSSHFRPKPEYFSHIDSMIYWHAPTHSCHCDITWHAMENPNLVHQE